MNNDGGYKVLGVPGLFFYDRRGLPDIFTAAHAYDLVNKLTWPDSPGGLCRSCATAK